MTVQTRTISVQEIQERLPALLEMARSRKERFIIEDDGTPVAVLVAADVYDAWLCEQGKSEHPHIGRIEGICGGEPIILGTRISVVRIVQLFRAYGSVDEILESTPHLTPAQVYDALSYYYDHKEKIEHLMEQGKLENVLERSGMVLKEVSEGIYEAQTLKDE